MAQQVDAQRSMSNYKIGTRRGEAVNDAAPINSARNSHNKFPMSYPFAMTARYGEIYPFFVMNGEPKDVIPIQSDFSFRSLALQSPIESSLYMQRSYYDVKMQAILPRTFEYIYKNPVQGDDVPDDAYCNWGVSYNLFSILREYNDNFLGSLDGKTYDRIDSDGYIAAVRVLLILQSVYSVGGLPAYLGCPLNGYAIPFDPSVGPFDDEVITCLRALLTNGPDDTVPVFSFPDLISQTTPENANQYFSVGDSVLISLSDVDNTPIYSTAVSFTRMLELLRSYNPSAVGFYHLDESGPSSETVPDRIYNANILFNFSLPPHGMDVSRIAAYQLVCAEWFTNDKVDYVYNADLWRKSQDFYVRMALGNVSFFDFNDIAVMYDALSYKNVKDMYVVVRDSADVYSEKFSYVLDFLSNLFFFNRSLKFEDYFAGARTRPLAVGDNKINDPSDPLDFVRSLQMTRFLNAVNRAGMDEDYLSQIMGTLPAPDVTRPSWIDTYDDVIQKFEVENTSENQGNITSGLRSHAGKHKYTSVRIEGYPSIVLGLCSFSMPRLYVNAIDRDFFVKDRYDMFNPYFQYEGDQKIFRSELFPITGDADDASFAYTGRGNHRKQRVGRAVGGFVRWLPSWVFMVDDKQSGVPFTNLNPEYILSSASEFDRFFKGFASDTLDGYFHFEIVFVNHCDALRAMAFAPGILNG